MNEGGTIAATTGSAPQADPGREAWVMSARMVEGASSTRQREESRAAARAVSPPAPPAQAAAGVGAGLYQGDVVSEILRELEAELGVTPAAEPDAAPMLAATEQEYQLLSDYFKSAVLPDLVPPQ